MADPIGALRVLLSAAAAQFEADTKKARGSLERLGQSAAQMGKAIALAGAAAAGALALMVKRSIDAADAAFKAAQGIGVTVEELTALQHAADLSGVDVETFRKALGRMARSSSDAAHGLQTQKRAFDALRISVLDANGQLRPQTEILGDIAEQFSRLEDGARKTALAQEIFGRAGTALIPLLNGGRDGLAQMTAEARDLGLVIDTETARAAEKFNDDLTRMRRVLDGIVNQIAQEVLPKLVAIGETILHIFADTNQTFAAEQRAIRGLGDDVDALASREERLNNEIKTLRAELAQGEPGQFIDRLEFAEKQEELDGLIRALDFLQDRLFVLRSGATKPLLPPPDPGFGTATAAATEALGQLAGRLAAVKLATTEEAEGLRQFIAELQKVPAVASAAGEDAATLAEEFQDSLSSAFASGKLSFKRLADSVIADLRRIIAQALVLRFLSSLFGGIPGVGQLLNPTPKGKAHGGPVRRGEMVVVGERGPELFVAGMSGQVATQRHIERAADGGGSGVVEVRFSADSIPEPTDFGVIATRPQILRLFMAMARGAKGAGFRFEK